jgi:hypothetical protein
MKNITRFNASSVRALGVALTLVASLASADLRAQQAFPTPDAAAEALVDGLARHDPDRVKAVLGADYRRYIPLTADADRDRTNFLAAWAHSHRIVNAGADKAWVEVGRYGWTLPIPLARTSAGWRFYTVAGAEEMRIRRIGRNELDVMQVMLAYVDMQEEYQQRDRDGDGVRQYARRLLSSPGKRDGLYWATFPNEPESPAGAGFADARAGQGYHGYHYHILEAQGRNAPGGAKSYVRGGRMTDGFALVAWPMRYGDTGVMTFIVSKDGVIYQKDLGPGGAAAARAMRAFDPDSSWTKVEPPKL